MSCKPIKLKDGTAVLVNMARRGKLSERDLKTLEEYAEYCRQRAAERQRERNAKL
jgi:predicted DNA-binding antitoxin AbrB/MazE fold protein